MTTRDILNNVVVTATINADGDENKGTVSLILVKVQEPDDSLWFRWYAMDDPDEGDWQDTETSGETRERAIENAYMVWAGDDWDLRIAGQYR